MRQHHRPFGQSEMALGPRSGRPGERARAWALFGAVAVVLIPSIAASDEGFLSAAAVMERVDARERGRSEASDLEMILVSSGGERRPRELDSWRLEGETARRTLLRFVEPADLRGTALLTHDHIGADAADDQWIYLPALRSLKRVAKADQSSSFLGSDFSYADLTRQELQRYRYRFLGGLLAGDPTWWIEATPDPEEKERTGYERSVLEVRKDNFVVVGALHEISNSSRVKKFKVTRLEKIDGVWLAIETDMSTWERDSKLHETQMRISEVRLNQHVDTQIFRPNRVARGD